MGLGAWLRIVLPVGLGLALAVACGGSVDSDNGKKKDGGGTGGLLVGGSGGTGGTIHTGGTGGKKDAGKDVQLGGAGGTGGYVDPGCPDAAPPPPDLQCDPYGPNTCGQGEACYPYVSYPTQPCEQEQYGAVCAPEGSGQQGDPCGSINCSGGFICVITGQGTQCVQLCKLASQNTCPDGLICMPVDVEGIGGCY